MNKIEQEIKRFNEERDWDQFHSPENLAKSIAIEAGELLECFQWNSENYNKEEVCEEEMSSKDFRRLLYMSKPFVLKNLAYQKEENIRFISNFKDNFATYLIKIA